MSKVIVAGTGCSPLAGRIYYSRMAQAVDARVRSLSRSGMDHVNGSVNKLARYLENRPEKTTLIGHSQGGLVSALVGLRYPHLVDKVVTICAPLRGTPLSSSWIRYPVSAHCMCPESKVCREIANTPWPDEVELITVAASRDILVPTESALMGKNQYTFDTGHVNIVLNSSLFDLLASIL